MDKREGSSDKSPKLKKYQSMRTPLAKKFSFLQQSDDEANDSDENSSVSEEEVRALDGFFADFEEQLEQASESNQKLSELIA